MSRKTRFMNEDDLAKAFKLGGYNELRSVDPDIDSEAIYLTRTLKLPDDTLGKVEIKISRSNYSPMMEIFFPTVFRNGRSIEKNVVISYKKDSEGMVPTSVDSTDKGHRIINM